MLLHKPPTRVWAFTFLLIVGLGLVFYLVLVRGANSTITQQLFTRKQTLARAQASNLTSFFQTFGQSVAMYAQLSSMARINSETRHDMEVFVDQWRDTGLVGGLILTNAQGKAQLNANILGTSDVGASVADRDYFTWAKSEPHPNQYFVGQPIVSRLGATKDQVIVPVAAAVYQDDVFIGSLTASVKLQALTERYLEILKISDVNSVYLVDTQGNIVYSTTHDAFGTPINKFVPQLATLNTAQEGSFKSGPDIIAYAPISLEHQDWLLVIAAPFAQITDITTPIYLRLMAVLTLVSFTILLFGALTTRTKPSQNTLS